MLYAQQPAAPSHVAKEMHMTKGAITKLVDRLTSKALVIRNTNTKDARAQTIVLTTKGKKWVPELAVLADQNDSECFTSLIYKRSESVAASLEKLVRQLGASNHPYKVKYFIYRRKS